MSALPRTQDDMGCVGLRMTAAEFFTLGETRERVELIDGVVILSPSPTPRHQALIYRIAGQLNEFEKQSPVIHVFMDTDLELAESLVYRPDISIYLTKRLPAIPTRLALPPDLVIEVLSTGSKPLDLITKRDDYERFGVAEYWAVDPADLRVRGWHRHGARLLETPIAGDRIASVAIPDFVLDITRLRAALA